MVSFRYLRRIEALHSQTQDVASQSAVRLMDSRLAPISALVSQWALLPAVADRVEKARAYLARKSLWSLRL